MVLVRQGQAVLAQYFKGEMQPQATSVAAHLGFWDCFTEEELDLLRGKGATTGNLIWSDIQWSDNIVLCSQIRLIGQYFKPMEIDLNIRKVYKVS